MSESLAMIIIARDFLYTEDHSMSHIRINKQIENIHISISLKYGRAYVLNTPIQGIHEQIFDEIESLKFVNCPFKNAIKINPYIKRNKISPKSLENLQSHYQFKLPEIGDYSMLDKVIFTILNEFIHCHVIIVELTGLAPGSIQKLKEFTLDFLKTEPDKIIVFVSHFSDVNFQFAYLKNRNLG